MPHFTPSAQEQLKKLTQGQDSSTMGLFLNLDTSAQLRLELVQLNKLKPEQVPLRDPKTNFFVEWEAFLLVSTPEAQKNLAEGIVDYESGGLLSGRFLFKEKPVDPVLGKLNADDPIFQQVKELLEKEINPGLAMHGGRAELLNVKEGQVYLKFGGGCQGCSMIDVTVKQGIETRLKSAFPQISAVVDYTDHASGKNPFF